MADNKKIKDMSDTDLRHELGEYCAKQTKNGSCKSCVLSGIHRFDDDNSYHNGLFEINDRYTLALMVSLARGYLEWKHSYIDPNDPTVDQEKPGSNVPEQPTVPPMPEPVESVIDQVTELTPSIEGNLLIDGYADATQIVISGKKPTSLTVFYDQEGGGDS